MRTPATPKETHRFLPLLDWKDTIAQAEQETRVLLSSSLRAESGSPSDRFPPLTDTTNTRGKMITIDKARTLYEAAGDSTHDFDHVLRVYRLAERIGHAEGADMTVLRTATLLHDIARPDQDAGRVADHAVEGARRAQQMLDEQPPEFVESVTHAIETHRFRTNRPPQTLEAKILYDADKLDAIGAVGIARAFAYGAHRGQRLWAEPEASEHTAIKEFAVKLSKVKDTLFTEAARAVASKRHSFMADFFEEMAAEVAGER